MIKIDPNVAVELRNYHKLRRLSEAGLIKWPVNDGHYYVEEGTAGKNGFEWGRMWYRVEYRDGSFYPYVFCYGRITYED